MTTHCSQHIHLPPPPPAITTCVLLGDYSLQPTDPSPTSTPSYHHLCVTGWLLTAANRSISHLHPQLSPPVCYWVTTHCSQQIHLHPSYHHLCVTGWLLTAANRSISHLHPQLSPPVCYWVTTHCSQQIHLPPPPPAITTCVLLGDYSLQPTDPSPTSTPSYHHLCVTGWLLTAAIRSISHLHPQLSPPVCYWVTTHCSQQIHLPPPPPAITTCVLLGDYSLQPTDPSPTSTPSYHHLCVTGWLLTAANRSISHLHPQLSPPVCYWVTTLGDYSLQPTDPSPCLCAASVRSCAPTGRSVLVAQSERVGNPQPSCRAQSVVKQYTLITNHVWWTSTAGINIL